MSVDNCSTTRYMSLPNAFLIMFNFLSHSQIGLQRKVYNNHTVFCGLSAVGSEETKAKCRVGYKINAGLSLRRGSLVLPLISA